MANYPVKTYDGNYITCYPGSNQSDDGKLNMEFNMARLVTRVSSKNFCIVKPSFELKSINGNNGKRQIEVGVGECSINGMDLIMTQKLTIDLPEDAGTYYLAFKLKRDEAPNPNNKGNVLGDTIYGITRTFEGIYLTFYDSKPEPLIDMDMLYLGKVEWDGINITSLEEDEDKYGRLWAEDIMCKIKDPKHPDISRMILQDWIYKIPDWYVSKEGDVEYGEIDFMAGRSTEGTYGVHIKAVDDNNSEFIMKAPLIDINSEEDRFLKVFASNNGLDIRLGKSRLLSSAVNNYDLILTTPNNIGVTSDKIISLIGKTGLSLGTGNNGQGPKLSLKDNEVTISSSINTNGLVDKVTVGTDTLTHTIGKSVLRYSSDTSSLILQDTDTNFFKLNPNVDIGNNIRVKETLYLGWESIYGNEKSYLTDDEWKISDGTSSIVFTPKTQILVDSIADSGYVKVTNKLNGASSYGTLFNSGKLELYNSSANSQILFKNGSPSYDVILKHTTGNKGNGTGTVGILDITAGHIKASGDLTVTGEIRASKVYNAVYNDYAEIFEKDENEVIECGDVICIRRDGLVHRVDGEKDFNTIIGICSDSAGMLLGGKDIPEEKQVVVGMCGKIWTKSNDKTIAPGDMVKVLSDGTIMRTDDRHIRFGIALSNNINGKVRIVFNG